MLLGVWFYVVFAFANLSYADGLDNLTTNCQLPIATATISHKREILSTPLCLILGFILAAWNCVRLGAGRASKSAANAAVDDWNRRRS
jgi:hypothetical protein